MFNRGGLISIVAVAALLAATPTFGKGVPTGGKCGGLAGLKCASKGDFCMMQAGKCTAADAEGVCTAKPQICPEVEDPVCGCDKPKGKTYGNECKAHRAGVSGAARGACKKG